MSRNHWAGALGALGLIAIGGAAAAFGTIQGLGQNAEHERITRHALGCGAGRRDCFEPATLDELAGRPRSFGAVGAPDRGTLTLQAKAHCDRGDFLAIPGYPQSAGAARGNIENCRAWMRAELDEAIADAGGLLDADGNLRPGQLGLDCTFVGGVKGRAKCNVLEDFGIVLHAAQDFYSHSNWVDRPDPRRPIGLDNPPGLGRSGPSPYIALGDEPQPFPPGLITGCYGVPEARFCRGRVMHFNLNKDEGQIDPAIGAGTTPRGSVDGNFRRAVEAAMADSQDKWKLLRNRLKADYGARRGALMACAISHDDPMRDCR